MECNNTYHFPKSLSPSLAHLLSRAIDEISEETIKEERILNILQNSMLPYHNHQSPRELPKSPRESRDPSRKAGNVNYSNFWSFAKAVADDENWRKAHPILTRKVMHAAKKICQKPDAQPLPQEIIPCLHEIERLDRRYERNRTLRESLVYMIATKKLCLKKDGMTKLSKRIENLSIYDYKVPNRLKVALNTLLKVQTDEKTTFTTIPHLLTLLSTGADIDFILKTEGFLDKIIEYGIEHFDEKEIFINFVTLLDRKEVSKYIHKITLDGKKLSLENTKTMIDYLPNSLKELHLLNFPIKDLGLIQKFNLTVLDCSGCKELECIKGIDGLNLEKLVLKDCEKLKKAKAIETQHNLIELNIENTRINEKKLDLPKSLKIIK